MAEKLFDKFYDNNEVDMKRERKASVEKQMKFDIKRYALDIEQIVNKEEDKISAENAKISTDPLTWSIEAILNAERKIEINKEILRKVKHQYEVLFGEAMD